MSMGNFPAFDWLVKDVLKIDPNQNGYMGQFNWTHPKTHKVMTGYPLLRGSDNWWADNVGYWGKMRFEFFEESEQETLRYLDILGLTKNYFAYYNHWVCQRFKVFIPEALCKLTQPFAIKEEILQLKERDYNGFMRRYRDAERWVREVLTDKVLSGHNNDKETDLVLWYFFDEIQKYLEGNMDEIHHRRDTPMMLWKNLIRFYPDFDENFQEKLKNWRFNRDIDERFFPDVTPEEKKIWETKQAIRRAELDELLARKAKDDISVEDEFIESPV